MGKSTVPDREVGFFQGNQFFFKRYDERRRYQLLLKETTSFQFMGQS